jgi:hypothetical protein
VLGDVKVKVLEMCSASVYVFKGQFVVVVVVVTVVE